jgi:hypothetical protein
MCLALYIASDQPLTLIPWRDDRPAFHVTELKPEQEHVRRQFSHPHVYFAGGHEGCACPFNYGREFPEHEDDPEQLTAARECVARLSAFVHESKVAQIYTCQFDEEYQPREHKRSVTPEQLRAPEFVFRDRELLEIVNAAPQRHGEPSAAKRLD